MIGMPSLYGARNFMPGWMRRAPAEVTGENLATSSPGTWQMDKGITKVASEDWGTPGADYSPSGTHITSGPYAGYSLRSARSAFGGGPARTARAPAVRPQAGTQQMGGAPSARNPKRLWNYQLANLAPGGTTLGRMRTLASGFISPMFRT